MAIINVPDDFSTIQLAVNSASEGDVILVDDGTYNEEVDITTDNIRIVANGKNVILDGAVGSLNIAFDLDDVTGVEIKGFKIQNYIVGFSVNRSDFNRIIRNKIMNVRDGIQIEFSNGNLIWKNEVKGNDFGHGIILFSSSNNNWIIENIVHRNDAGLFVQNNSLNNAFIDNQSFNNKVFGFSASAVTSNTLILRNEVFKNGVGIAGILNSGSPNSVLLNNKIKDNDGNGLFLSHSGNCIVSKNEIKRNGGNGINTFRSDFLIIQENKIEKNKENGINLALDVDKNTIIRNCIERNKEDGINIAGNENNIVQNKVCDNKVLDIDDNSSNNNFADNECDNSEPPDICTGCNRCCCRPCDDD